MTDRAGDQPVAPNDPDPVAPALDEPADDDGIVGREHLGALLPFLSEAVFLYDAEGNLKARLSPPGGILGHGSPSGTNVFDYVHPDDARTSLELGAEVLSGGPGTVGEGSVRLHHADGSWRRYRLRLANHYADPTIAGLVATVREEPEPKVEGEDLRADRTIDDEVGAFADDLPTAYLALGATGRVRFASEAALELLRSRRDDLVGLPIDALVVDRDRPAVLAAHDALRSAAGARTVVVTTRTRFAGRVVEAEFHTRSGDHDHKIITVVLVDHTEEPELVRLATRDAMTGLANRTKVLDTITGLLLADEPELSVVYVDLDDLKMLNDVHGHEVGDRALVAVAHRLQDLVRPTDVVGRMSGDEFVIVCPQLDGSALMRFVERVGQRASSLQITGAEGEPIELGVSAGGATAVAGDTTTSLLRRADEAMFEAKRAR